MLPYKQGTLFVIVNDQYPHLVNPKICIKKNIGENLWAQLVTKVAKKNWKKKEDTLVALFSDA